MRARAATLVVGMLVLMASLVLPLASQQARGASYDWPTDQVIDTAITVTGDTINLTGNLTITPTGSLTLNGATLEINSNTSMRYRIEVQGGGTLKVLSGSTIKTLTASTRYLFCVRPSAVLQVDLSTVRDCGYQCVSRPNNGLYIQSSQASITNSTLTNNFAGVITDNGSTPQILSNTITANDWCGVVALNGSRPKIDRNTISRNLRSFTSGTMTYGAGVFVDHASPYISNNSIEANVASGGSLSIGVLLFGMGYTNVTDNVIGNHTPATAGGWVGGLYTDTGSPYIARNFIYKNFNGLDTYNGSALVEHNIIESNVATSRGWGLIDGSGSTFHDNVYSGNNYGPVLVDNSHSTFTNEVIKNSLVVGIAGDGSSSPFSGTFINCSLSNNVMDLHLGKPLGGTTGGTCVLLNTPFYNVTANITDPNSMLIVKWFLHVRTTIESSGAQASDAKVKCLDRKGLLQMLDVTGADGWTNWMVVTQYNMGGSDDKNFTYAPYNITAEKGSLFNYTVLPFDQSYEFTLPLDDIMPWNAVTYPEEGAVINRTSVNVTGTAEPGTWVTANGVKAVMLWNGDWYATVPLQKEGANTLTVSVVDRGKNRMDTVINVTRDTTPPTLDVTTPSDNFLSNKADTPVAGTTSDIGGKVFVNHVEVPIAPDGSFSTTVPLLEGPVTVLVEAVDAVWNTATVQRRGELDITAPQLVVLQPNNNFATNASSVLFKGYTDPDSTVTIDGKSVSMYNANFSGTISLVEGDNDLAVNATDPAGNIRTVMVRVHRDSTPPELSITWPPNGLAVNASLIEVRGTTETGAKVRVNGAAVTFAGRNFVGQARLDKEGNNVIRIDAYDALNNHVQMELTVRLDTTPPDLKISIPSPTAPALTNQLSIDIKGTTEATANVTINEEPVTVDSKGIFTGNVALGSEGANEIVITSTDIAGNIAETIITVTRDTKVVATVTYPKDGQKTKWSNLTVSGQAEPGSTVTVQGQPVTVRTDGSFSAEVFLQSGANTILISVKDKAGNVQNTNITVTKTKGTTPPPGLIPGFEGPVTLLAAGIMLVAVGRLARRNRR